MADRAPPSAYAPPKGATLEAVLPGPSGLAYSAIADWVVLRKDEKPVAEVFFVAYLAAPRDRSRPLTFVFNGGPGASSVYLHLGAAGPVRAVFSTRGGIAPPPARVTDNLETWLAFTDLVFVDPVGTGWSRVVEDDKKAEPEARANSGASADPKPHEFYQLNRDLESLGEVMSRFLSQHGRWGSPVILAGESYGGFRVAKLARSAQERFGVGLSAVVLISPALELTPLVPTDYDLDHWLDVTPTMAATAHVHGRGQATFGRSLAEALAASEEFALSELLSLLAAGDRLPEERRLAITRRLASLIGLSPETCARHEGRIPFDMYARELLRAEGKVLGMYDASATVDDPFPDRRVFDGPDPTLAAIEPVFCAAVNDHLRRTIGVSTDRQYRLLDLEVNASWRIDTKQHALARSIGATDDLRYGMALNPHMRVLVCHGVYDLVTPYFASARLVGRMKLRPAQRARVELRSFEGGHMFYTWDDSRAAFTAAIRELVTATTRAAG